MASGFLAFLESALALVERDAPFCTAAMGAALARVRVVLQVDSERCVVLASGRSVRAFSSPAASLEPAPDCAVLCAAPEALLALVDGADLVGLLTSDRVRVRATPERAALLFDVMRLFVEGCARSPRIVPLLAAFRAEVESSSKGAEP
jgi:hypothetical protein